MKILVLGSNGMAGHMIVKYLRQQGHSVSTLARSNADFILDIEEISSTEKFFKLCSEDFDFIINCIGLLVKDSIENPNRAIIINSWLPHTIENAIKYSETKLIHLSTDCVFDGLSGNYKEDDIHTERNFYGRSKSLGEVNNSKDITFRLSIIGPELKTSGSGLFNWLIHNKERDIPGWENAMWNGITTLQLAKCIEKYINDPSIFGIYNLVNNHVYINKYDLLCKINDIFNLDKNIIRTHGPKTINKILVDTRQSINFEIPDYQKQLLDLKNFI